MGLCVKFIDVDQTIGPDKVAGNTIIVGVILACRLQQQIRPVGDKRCAVQTGRRLEVITRLLALIAVVIFAPAWAGAAATLALLISSAIATFSVVQKQMKLYREKPTSWVKLARNVLFEIFI